MSGWGREIDDLAAVVAGLLTHTSVRTSLLTDAAATLACRDAVVVQLRQFVGPWLTWRRSRRPGR